MVFTLRDYVAVTFAKTSQCAVCKTTYRQPLEDLVCSTCRPSVVPSFEEYLRTQGIEPAGPARGSGGDVLSQSESASPQLSESDVEVSDFDDDDEFAVVGDGQPEDWWECCHVKHHKAQRKLAALFSCWFLPAQRHKECVFKFQPDDSTGSFPMMGKRAKFFTDSRAIYWVYGETKTGKNWFLRHQKGVEGRGRI